MISGSLHCGLYQSLIALTLLFSAAAQAQDAGYELTGYVVAGGSSIDGGDYAMSGALGQPDTGTLTGGDYSLGGGFFGGGVISGGTRSSTYLPTMRR
jgi:hypothetical protein